MSQIFTRSANSISRVSIIGGGLLIGLLLGLVWELGNSPWVTRQYAAREQPMSHHELLVTAFRRAADSAYAAVAVPREGTVLSVARAAADAVEQLQLM
mgnify:CR=1 FL=1